MRLRLLLLALSLLAASDAAEAQEDLPSDSTFVEMEISARIGFEQGKFPHLILPMLRRLRSDPNTKTVWMSSEIRDRNRRAATDAKNIERETQLRAKIRFGSYTAFERWYGDSEVKDLLEDLRDETSSMSTQVIFNPGQPGR